MKYVWHSFALVHCLSILLEQTVRISVNSIYYLTCIKAVPILTTLSPSIAFSSGNTVLAIQGSKFFSNAELSCSFFDGTTTTTVAATFVSDSQIKCITPALAVGTYSVSAKNFISTSSSNTLTLTVLGIYDITLTI